jgi:hypothetical protein
MTPPSPIKRRDTPGAYSQHRVEHLLFRLGGKHLTDVLNHKAEIENYGFDLQLAGLDLGKIENVVNDGEKGLSRCVASLKPTDGVFLTTGSPFRGRCPQSVQALSTLIGKDEKRIVDSMRQFPEA